MGSKTKKTELRRKKKHRALGRRRKNDLDNKGNTPKFPIHKDAAG